MKTIKHFLTDYPREVWTVSPGDTVIDALKLMEQKNIGAVVVMRSDQLVGILSERDYARKVVLKGKNSTGTRVSEIMTGKVITISAEYKIDECMQIMSEHHIRHLPILAQNKMVGIISMRDVVKEMIKAQQKMIYELQKYISG